MGVRRVAAKTATRRHLAQTELFQQQADTKGSVPGPQLSREGLGSCESGWPPVAERQHLSTKEAGRGHYTGGHFCRGDTSQDSRLVNMLNKSPTNPAVFRTLTTFYQSPGLWFPESSRSVTPHHRAFAHTAPSAPGLSPPLPQLPTSVFGCRHDQMSDRAFLSCLP